MFLSLSVSLSIQVVFRIHICVLQIPPDRYACGLRNTILNIFWTVLLLLFKNKFPTQMYTKHNYTSPDKEEEEEEQSNLHFAENRKSSFITVYTLAYKHTYILNTWIYRNHPNSPKKTELVLLAFARLSEF